MRMHDVRFEENARFFCTENRYWRELEALDLYAKIRMYLYKDTSIIIRHVW